MTEDGRNEEDEEEQEREDKGEQEVEAARGRGYQTQPTEATSAPLQDGPGPREDSPRTSSNSPRSSPCLQRKPEPDSTPTQTEQFLQRLLDKMDKQAEQKPDPTSTLISSMVSIIGEGDRRPPSAAFRKMDPLCTHYALKMSA